MGVLTGYNFLAPTWTARERTAMLTSGRIFTLADEVVRFRMEPIEDQLFDEMRGEQARAIIVHAWVSASKMARRSPDKSIAVFTGFMTGEVECCVMELCRIITPAEVKIGEPIGLDRTEWVLCDYCYAIGKPPFYYTQADAGDIEFARILMERFSEATQINVPF